MKNLKFLLATIILAIGSMTLTSATAQVKFGVKAGVAINDMHFNKKAFDADNQAGFTGGLMMDFTVPVIGVGFDLSAMYVRRTAKYMADNNLGKDHRDYIEIPLNLKYKIGLPGVGRFITPFVTTGPSVAFLTSKRHSEYFTNKSNSWAWNFGLGVQLLGKVQLHAGYGLGISKAVKVFDSSYTEGGVGRNRYWTVTAAYLF